MYCYKCHSNMSKKTFHNVIIDICPICGAVWLDQNEFDLILFKLNKNTKNIQKQLRKQIIHENNKLTTIGLCPKCNTNKLIIKYLNGIQLDYCQNCKGYYFDYKEFDKLIKICEKQHVINFFKKIKLKLINIFKKK